MNFCRLTIAKQTIEREARAQTFHYYGNYADAVFQTICTSCIDRFSLFIFRPGLSILHSEKIYKIYEMYFL